jgi:hypothetical protein
LVKATGKKRKKLNKTGKVKLSVAVTYTPTNGDPSTPVGEGEAEEEALSRPAGRKPPEPLLSMQSPLFVQSGTSDHSSPAASRASALSRSRDSAQLPVLEAAYARDRSLE